MNGPRRFHSHRLRHGRRSEAGRAYLITTVARDRRHLFRNPSLAMAVARSIHYMRRFGHQTLCYVIMPDHLHWLMQLGKAQQLSDTVGMMKNLAS